MRDTLLQFLYTGIKVVEINKASFLYKSHRKDLIGVQICTKTQKSFRGMVTLLSRDLQRIAWDHEKQVPARDHCSEQREGTKSNYSTTYWGLKVLYVTYVLDKRKI